MNNSNLKKIEYSQNQKNQEQVNSYKEKQKNFEYYTEMLFKNNKNNTLKTSKTKEKKEAIENNETNIYENINENKITYHSLQITKIINKNLQESKLNNKINQEEEIDSYLKLEEYLKNLDNSDISDDEPKQNTKENNYLEKNLQNSNDKKFNENEANLQVNISEEKKDNLILKTKQNDDKQSKTNLYDSVDNINNFDLNVKPKNFNFYSLSFDKRKFNESIEQMSKFDSSKNKDLKEIKNFRNEKVLKLENLIKSDYSLSFSVNFYKRFVCLFLIILYQNQIYISF